MVLINSRYYFSAIPGLEAEQTYDVRMLAGTSVGYPNLLDINWPWTSVTMNVLECPEGGMYLKYNFEQYPKLNYLSFNIAYNYIDSHRKTSSKSKLRFRRCTACSCTTHSRDSSGGFRFWCLGGRREFQGGTKLTNLVS